MNIRRLFFACLISKNNNVDNKISAHGAFLK
jgi:hypothetical protein